MRLHQQPASWGSSQPCAVCIEPSPRFTIDSYPEPCSPFPQSIPSQQNNVNNSFVFMSSTGQATSSTSNVQLIIDALADYLRITGIDLASNPFAAVLEQSSSLEAILQLLQEREKAFKEYRDGNRGLISCISPAVKILQAFSGILGEAASLVSYTCHLVSF
jgi:hypothetical protein